MLSEKSKSYIIQEVNRIIMPKYEARKAEHDNQAEICQRVNREIGLALADYANEMMEEAIKKYPFLSRKEVKRVSLDSSLFLQRSAREVWRRDSENEILSTAHEIFRKLETDKNANIFELLREVK